MLLIVVPPKRIDLLLRLNGCEPMDIQTLLAEASVERLDRRVVRRLATATEVQHDAVGVRPQIHGSADRLCPVVTVDAPRQAPLKPQALEGRDDVPAAETVADG